MGGLAYAKHHVPDKAAGPVFKIPVHKEKTGIERFNTR